MESVLKIENLKCKDVLKDITFSLEEKSFNILIGANGSGKTTLVKCIRNMLPYEGDISIFNNSIDKNTNYNNVVFFVDEDVFLEGIVFDELIEILINLDYDSETAEKQIFGVAKKIDATDILFKESEKLKSYEKTIISFIISIFHNPKLLVIDNDLEDLDENYKIKIFKYLKSQKNLTILFITNNSEYFYMADNYFLLIDGKIVHIDSFDKLVDFEKKLVKSGAKLPFNIDLSNKLISYELLNSIEMELESVVNKIWK